jgi:hypothetical protein
MSAGIGCKLQVKLGLSSMQIYAVYASGTRQEEGSSVGHSISISTLVLPGPLQPFVAFVA